jgi:hypothetical protein
MSDLREDRRRKTRLTSRQRLTRGLHYTAQGPVDVTRGALGLGLHGAYAAGSGLRRRYRGSRIAEELTAAQDIVARELAAAQEVAASLPQAIKEARGPSRRRRRLVMFSAIAATLAGGAVAFSIIRRSMQPEPSPRPPSVDVEPRP